MTKSQNTKNEQQKDLCITSEQLTEQFLDDEIDESKLYYFKQKMSEEIEIGHPFSLNMVRAMDDTYLDWFLIDKVLVPVPSYDEWKASEKYNKHLEEVIKIYERKDKQATETSIAYNELAKENEELKELLKECELWFTGIVGNMNDKNVGEHNRNLPIGNFEYAFKVFSQKINQTLGEDK